MKQINKKLAFRRESIRRLDQSGLTQARGGAKKKPSDEKNCTSDSDGDGHGGDGDSWSNTGSGSLNPITTLVRHQN